WSEDPAHLLGTLANYLRLEDTERAPDVQFRRAAEEAGRTVEELARRAAKQSRWRGFMARFLLGRVRALAGLREAPKFNFVLVLARARAQLREVGEELVRTGSLRASDEIFFLTLPEARAALQAADPQRTRMGL